ncbi:disease resistance protein RPM1-like [Ziziphus jujuba]|uniref:Disease resistance protein RPM1-like n=1 Tax=Ziziphus jujuba TaxID=326968 RepID=A0A6P4BF21_ZIZJJ|nr:disease resistance protein RPM1-like [Ziziphus jujuba]
MAESAVSFLLDNLTPLLQNEMQLLSNVHGQVRYILDELETIKAFLRVADAKQESNPGLKIWVEQVRDVAYDMEDVVDEFMLHLIYYHDSGFCSFCHRLYYFLRSLKARHRIASDMQLIKSRVNSVSKSYRRFNLDIPRSRSKAYRQLPSQGDARLLEEADLVGIGERKKHLMEWLLNNETGRQVISVVGMGGLGKTTLVNQVYKDPKVRKRFKVHAWITVSRSYKIDDLIEDMVQQIFTVIGKPVPQEVSNMNRDRKRETIKDFLQQSRYLIVLDDVWDVKFWDTIKLALPSSNKYGSRIMVTTRNASCVEIHDKVYNLEPLSPEESWGLLCKKTFQGKPCPSNLEEICHCILNRCGGLPLAIAAISAVLATKDQANIDEWVTLSRTFGPEMGENSRVDNMNRVLSLSLNDLPYYLKSCFMYLSMFPPFQKIETMTLIRLWIAEGFVIEKEGITPEEVAEGYIKELLDRGLIQVAGTTSCGRIKSCKVHDLLREIAIQKSKDQNFGVVVKEQGVTLPDKVRRLSVVKTLHNVQNKNLSRLRSLFVFNAEDSLTEFPKLFPRSLKLLKVLELRGAPIENFPEEVCKLFYLKFLGLKKTKVKHIPRSIKKLQNLETLNLKDSFVTELPVEILSLKRLRHLLVYRYQIESYVHFDSKIGVNAPDGIGCLQSLQKLCFIEGNQENLTELGKLNQLRRLGIVKFRERDGSALCCSIQKLINLRSLSITSEEKTDIIDLQHISSPPQYLQHLYLAGHMETLPQWINSLQNLAKLFLKWSRLKEDPLVHLQHLPNLMHLEFLQVYEGESLHFKAGGFPSLKILGLDKLDALQSVTIDEGAIPHLERLTFQRCKLLKKVPTGIEFLTNLKLLEFFDMPDELIMKLRPDGGEDHSKVAHVSAVYSVYWLGDGWDVFSLERFTERDTSPQPYPEMRSYRRSTLWKV